MAVIVAIAGPVLIAIGMFVTVPGRMGGLPHLRGLAIRGDHSGPRYVEPGESRQDRGLLDRLAVILDPDGAGGAGVGLDDAGNGGQRFSHRARAAFMRDALHRPQPVSVAPAELGASRPHQFAQSRQGQLLGVEVHA